MLALKLPCEVEKRLEKAARGTGRTKRSLVREAILRYLDDLEDISVAVERLEKPGKRWTLAELEKGLDLEG
jgi:RHH-type transcriptional regulator, rel operon repressor / antitoxin RelB